MSNSSSPLRSILRNVPPPQGSKAGSAYSRFIPREELGEVESWKPGALADADEAGDGAAAALPPQGPGGEDGHARLHAARQAGYQDGYRDGLAALESFKQHFAAQATAQLGCLLDAFDQQLGALDAQIAQTMARSAVQLARQVVRSELHTHPELVAQVAADAVAAVMLSARHIRVFVHPGDLPLVSEGAQEALAARGARLAADPAIERGGVRVESDVGMVDARIAERWSQAAAALGADMPLVDAADAVDAAAGPGEAGA